MNLTDRVCYQRSNSPQANSPSRLKRLARGVLAVALGGALCFGSASAHAPSWQEMNLNYKHYALIKLNYNSKEFKCLNYIFSKESSWNPYAFNASVKPIAYGIPQLRSNYIIGKSAYQQIDLGVKYILHRYKSACAAKQHWLIRKWY